MNKASVCALHFETKSFYELGPNLENAYNVLNYNINEITAEVAQVIILYAYYSEKCFILTKVIAYL